MNKHRYSITFRLDCWNTYKAGNVFTIYEQAWKLHITKLYLQTHVVLGKNTDTCPPSSIQQNQTKITKIPLFRVPLFRVPLFHEIGDTKLNACEKKKKCIQVHRLLSHIEFRSFRAGNRVHISAVTAEKSIKRTVGFLEFSRFL